MKISMWMMYDAIAPYIRAHSLGDNSTECSITGVLPYLPSAPLSADHIYVISGESVFNLPTLENCFLIIYGAEPELPKGCQYILLKPELGLGEALSLALGAMEMYNQWYEKLQQELAGVPDLGRICSIGYELLGNPILLFDPDHVLIAAADVNPNSNSAFLEHKTGETLVLSDEAYKTIVSRPGHEDDSETGRVAYMPNPLGVGNILYTNIICRQLEYRLCVNDTNRGFTPGDIQLCKTVSDTLQTAMSMDHSRESSTKDALCDLFRDILENRAVENQTCESVLAAWNWTRHDNFICLGIEKTNLNLQFVSNDQYICSKIEELLSDACAFMHEGRLVCMVNLSHGLAAHDIDEKLESFLRDNIFTVGISDEFGDAVSAADYYKEACIAIKEGRVTQPGEIFYSFSAHAFDHLFRCGFDGLPPVCYCDGNVRRLAAMQDSRVDYCETLRTYIENDRNLLRTAELLHIHRTTLFYRLNKIKEELDVDLDDPEVRLRIWLSFKLLDFENMEQV